MKLNLSSQDLTTDEFITSINQDNLGEVNEIDAHDNIITDQGLSALMVKLRSNKNITTLNLGLNKIGDIGITQLALSLNETGIKRLIIYGNQITTVGLKFLLNKLQQNDKIIEIDIGSNNFNFENEVDLNSLLMTIKNNSTLEALGLGCCEINDVQFSKIISVVEASNIRSLNLINNCVTIAGLKILAAEKFRNIKINLKVNLITNEGIQNLFAALPISNNLYFLDILGNEIYSQTVSEIIQQQKKRYVDTFKDFVLTALIFAKEFYSESPVFWSQIPLEIVLKIMQFSYEEKIHCAAEYALLIFHQKDEVLNWIRAKKPFIFSKEEQAGKVTFFLKEKPTVNINHEQSALLLANISHEAARMSKN